MVYGLFLVIYEEYLQIWFRYLTQRFEWTSNSQETFNNIKGAITTTPFLISPYFQRDFIIYSFSIEGVFTSVLTKKNKNGEELPIILMRKTLHDYELKYSKLEK
jgi:hypothetical protein